MTKETAIMDNDKRAAKHDLDRCRKVQSGKMPAAHQARALTQLGDWYRAKISPKGALLCLPTGAGKTFTAIHFLCTGPLSDGYKVLWLAHTHHLLDQAEKAFDSNVLCHIREPREALTIRTVSGSSEHYKAHAIQSTDDVVVATLFTMSRAYSSRLAELESFLASADGKLIVVFDEAHHAPAPSFRKLLQALSNEHGATLLGLTATPTYTDASKRGWLSKLFPQGIVAKADRNELMATNILARPNYEPHETGITPDFDEREYRKWQSGPFSDLPEQMIEQLAKNAQRNEEIAATYAGNREKYGKTIIFADRWYQCEAIAAALDKHNIRAGSVYSHIDAPLSYEERRKRDKGENEKVLARFRQGELDVILNVRMLTEGTDLPKVQSVFLTRETTSQILMTQMIGRALRGPRFGGTSEANIVLFMDNWQQSIRFADIANLDGLASDAAATRSPSTPLQLISIELVRRLARELDTGSAAAVMPYLSYMPIGWYRVVYEVRTEGSEDVEVQERLVLVFDGEREGYTAVIRDLLRPDTKLFADEEVRFEDGRALLEALRTRHLGASLRDSDEVVADLFQLARHCGQSETAPEFWLSKRFHGCTERVT